MSIAEATPDYLQAIAQDLAEFLQISEEEVIAVLTIKPEETKAILKDSCLCSILSAVRLDPPYVYPDLEPGKPNAMVKKVAEMLMPIKEKALALVFPPREETAQGLAIKLAKLRSEYLVAIKLNPALALQEQYLLSRIRAGICEHSAISFGKLPPRQLMETLPTAEAEWLRKMFKTPTPAEAAILERIFGIVKAQAKDVVYAAKLDEEAKIAELIKAGISEAIARGLVKNQEEGLYWATQNDLLSLAIDEKRLQVLIDAIKSGIPLEYQLNFDSKAN